MATRYWVGGTGAWDATTTNWSTTSGGAGGASVPTSADDVIFDNLSNATAYTCTLTTLPVCASLTIAGPASGNITIAGTTTFSIYASCTLSATGITWSNTSVINFWGTGTFTTNGVSLTNLIQFNGNTTLGSALTTTLATGIQTAGGSLNTANYNLTSGGSGFSLSTAGTKTISFGSSIITVPTINFNLSTGLTFNAGTSTINCTVAGFTFQGGGVTFYNVNFTNTALTSGTIIGTNTFNNLTFPVKTVFNLTTIYFSNNQTINGTLTLPAQTWGSTRYQLASSVFGSPVTLTANIVSLNGVDFRDIIGAGIATWTGTRIGDCGGNSNIVTDTPKTLYWYSTTLSNWGSSGLNWSTSNGVSPTEFIPLPQDTAVINRLGNGQTLTLNTSYNLPTIDFSTNVNTITFATSITTPNIYGNLVLSSSTSLSGTGLLSFSGRNKTQTITSAGKSFTQPITINAIGSTVQLADNFVTSGNFTVSAGTFAHSTFTMSCLSYTLSAGTITGTGALTIGGNFTLPATGGTFSYTGAITFNATTTGWLLTTNGISTACSFTFNGAGGGWTLGSALTNTFNGSSLLVTQGTFNTGNYNVTLSTGNFYAGTGSLTRVINFGSSTITLARANAAFIGGPYTGLTVNAGTSNIVVTNQAGGIYFSGYNYYNITFTNTSAWNIVLPLSCNNLSITSLWTNSVTIVTGNCTVNGTFTCLGGTGIGPTRMGIASLTSGAPVVITANAVSLTDVDFRDITGAGTATWTGTRLGDCGGNSGISFPAPKTVYWYSTTSANFSSANWSLTNGGTPSAANYPLPQDTAIVNLLGAGQTLTMPAAYAAGYATNLPTLDFSTNINAITINFNYNAWNSYGDIKLSNSTSITFVAGGSITFVGRNKTQTITSAGKSFTQPINISAIGSTVQLADNFTTSSSITLTNGTLNLAGFTANTPTFVTAVGTKNITFNGGTLAVSGVTTTAFNNAVPTGFTTTAGTGTGTISMTGATAKTFVGGGSTYNCTLNQGGAGALTISGNNTFANITNTVQPSTVTFTASTNNTFANFNLNGTAGNLVTINSSTAGTRANLIKTGTGIVSTDYLSIQDSSVTPNTLFWYAGSNSTNVGNNIGWVFSAPSNGSFFLLW